MSQSDRPLVRIFSPYFPYPPTEGAFQIVVGQIDELAKLNRIQLVCWKNTEAEAKRRLQHQKVEDGPKNVDLVFISARTERVVYLSRAWRIVRSLFSRYSSVEEVYYPDVTASPILEPADLEIYHASLCLKWLERAYFPRAKKRVCYFHNIEANLFRQRAAAETNPVKRWMLNRFWKKLEKNERKLSELVDETWFVSRIDLAEAKERYRSPMPVLQAPQFSASLYRKRRLQRSDRSIKTNKIVGLLGALDFKPNEDSALFVIEKICPELLSLSTSCEVWIVGKNPSKRIIKLASPYPFVKITGFVDDIESFWKEIDCMVVPHVSGSGTRIKLLEALASGVPVIANEEAVLALAEETTRHELLSVVSLEQFSVAVKTKIQSLSENSAESQFA